MGKLWAAVILVFFCSIFHQICYYVLLYMTIMSTIILNVFGYIWVPRYCKCLHNFYWFAMFVFQQHLPRLACRCTIDRKSRIASSPNV